MLNSSFHTSLSHLRLLYRSDFYDGVKKDIFDDSNYGCNSPPSPAFVPSHVTSYMNTEDVHLAANCEFLSLISQ